MGIGFDEDFIREYTREWTAPDPKPLEIPGHPRFEVDGDVFKVTYDFTSEIQEQVMELVRRVHIAQEEALAQALEDLGWIPPGRVIGHETRLHEGKVQGRPIMAWKDLDNAGT